MRTPFYTATVANAYRMAIDGKASKEELMAELNTISHRPFCTGFYYNDPNALIPDTEGYIRDWLFVATALEDSKDGKVKVMTRNPFQCGDELQVLTPGSLGRPFGVTSIVNEDGEALARSATPMRVLTISAPDGILKGDIIRKRQ